MTSATDAKHRSSAAPLAWIYAGLIFYASLYPFSEWMVPAQLSFLGLGNIPWPQHRASIFDFIANLLGYMPLGALVFGALVRGGCGGGRAAWIAFCVGALLSVCMETLQNYLPQRVPSGLDWALNAAGTALGLGAAMVVRRMGGIDRWQLVRDRWFIRRSAGGIALLLLWPMGLLFPTPVPLGLGQVMLRAQELAKELLKDTPWGLWAEGWFDAKAALTSLSQGGEMFTTLLGLLAPCLVAFSVVRAGWRRGALVILAALLGFAATTLSTALNFGPEHALAWLTAPVLPGMGLAILVALMMADLPGRGAAAMGLIGLTALVVLVGQAPADPYYSQSLSAWEQGRFIRFHGAAKWVGWLWPYAALCYLFTRVVARDEATMASS
jgi:VanZ family protein